jgi:hypothetical protein
MRAFCDQADRRVRALLVDLASGRIGLDFGT